MSEELSASARKVQAYLREQGVDLRVMELPGSTRTAQDAADSVGCEVRQIAKSLIFRGRESGSPVLVVASGANRVDEARLEALVGEPVRMAKPDFVREITGFAIGGVPPCGHANPLPAILDEDLLGLDEIWAAAGTPHALFRLKPEELARLTKGRPARVRP
ncbi:MAG: YbaK/EbsC family protein [Desulfovibrio sp.]